MKQRELFLPLHVVWVEWNKCFVVMVCMVLMLVCVVEVIECTRQRILVLLSYMICVKFVTGPYIHRCCYILGHCFWPIQFVAKILGILLCACL